MTSIWGPMGWMTLHSVATLYPENPSSEERELMNQWIDMFRDTITCPSCREHFTGLLATYRQVFPNFLLSRQTFSVFSFRAHNAVNRRLQKPIHGTVEDCMAILTTNVKTRSAAEYRRAYLSHITRHWKTYQDISGISALRKIAQMNKIESEYCIARDSNFVVTLAPDTAVLPYGVIEKAPQESPVRASFRAPTREFRLAVGGIRIRR
jgi:hypothetical protein